MYFIPFLQKFKIDDVLVVCRPLVHQQDEYLSTLETFGIFI